MTRELFVSSTPHETKVGMVEDDQLAEVYLERENEYTLAGSIYKGRVTRVLPGMQSAFVDIGLERDAFLYVSDFMELENADEELDEIPTTPVVNERQRSEPAANAVAPAELEPGNASEELPIAASEPRSTSSSAPRRDDRGEFRGGRRRRRGRRDRPENGSNERPSRPVPSVPEVRVVRSERVERDEYGPPPGYQPMILPGESISKYRGVKQFAPESRAAVGQFEETKVPLQFESAAPLAETFPQDEPLFAQRAHEIEVSNSEVGSENWEREQKRLHEMNVAAVFGGHAAVQQLQADEHEVEDHEADEIGDGRSEDVEDRMTVIPARSDASPLSTAPAVEEEAIDEEEIDEEEADMVAYVEDLDADDAYDDLEEETHSAGDSVEPAEDIAASAEVGEMPGAASEASAEIAEVDEGPEAEAAEEDELEEAQAEAEALLASEGLESGTVDSSAEVRAPAATAAYTQRTARPADRERERRGNSGRRFKGGPRTKFRKREPQNLPLISDLLKEGQEILVQIAKEPIAKKGARITSHIALPGRFLVYMPTVNHTGVSRKIASEEERQRLKRIIISERENGHGGFIVRTAAQGADEQELRADIRFLKGLWNEIRTRAESSKPPALIYHDLNVVERVLRDQVTSDFAAIWVDTEQEYERILRFANRFQPALVRRVKLYSKEVPLFEQFGLKDEIDKALKSKVWLKSGGYIVINQTEALVAIDVNTGKYVGKTSRLEDTIVKTNVDAIKEIVRQIRLRDLGGIIIIDFIDMDERRNRQKVMQALEEALRADRSPSKVLQFNDFGLVAITRKRVKQSLERTIGSPCPYCEATGYVKNVNTVCNEIYVEMRKMAKGLDHADVMLRVNPEVAKGLKSNSGKWLIELEELTKKTVIVKSDPALHQEQFDIN